jgi:hypothetical protein
MKSQERPAVKGRIPPRLEMCRRCYCHVMPGHKKCPHCGVDLAKARRAWERNMKKVAAAHERLKAILARIPR